MLHCLASVATASLVLLATVTPPVFANTEILVSRQPFELADLPDAARSAPICPHVLEINSPQTLSVRLEESQRDSTQLLVPLKAGEEARLGVLGRLGELERAMGLEIRTVRLSWPASHPTSFHLSTHRAPPSSPHPHLPHLLISAFPSFVSSLPVNQTLEVPVTMLLEPVHFGGVPESTMPVVAVLLGLVGVAYVTGVAGGSAKMLAKLARADRKQVSAQKDEKAD